MYRSSLPLIVSVILSGCVGAASVGKLEIETYDSSLINLVTIKGYTKYARDLSGKYLNEATKSSGHQDALSLAVVGAAATGAGGLLFNSGFDLVKSAGLAAGTTTAVGNYLKPGETTLALLNAAEQLICIAKSGDLAGSALGPEVAKAAAALSKLSAAEGSLKDAHATAKQKEAEANKARDHSNADPNDEGLKTKAETARVAADEADKEKTKAESEVNALKDVMDNGSDENVLEAGDILGIGIRQVRINLRKTLVRQRPDYSTLLNQLSNPPTGQVNKSVSTMSSEELVEKLRSDVAKCLLIVI